MADTEIDRLVVRIAADSSLLQQEFNKARQSTRDFGQGAGSDLKDFTDKTRDAGDEIIHLKDEILALAGAAEFKDLIEGAFSYADSLKHLAEQTGFGTDKLQTLHAAGIQVGVATDSMDSSLKTFVERLGVFASSGSGLAAKAFQTLGVSTSNPIAAFDQVIDRLSKIPDVAERAGLAGQVFGKEFGPAFSEIATNGVAGLQALQDHLETTGSLITQEMIDKASETKGKFDELEFVFKQAFDEGIISGFTNSFGDFADIVKSGEFQTAIRNFGTLMGEIAADIAKIAPYLPNIAGAWAGAKAGARVGALIPGAGETGYSEAGGSIIGGILGAVSPEMFKGQESIFEGGGSSDYDPHARLKALQDQRDNLLKMQKEGKPVDQAAVDDLNATIDKLAGQVKPLPAPPGGPIVPHTGSTGGTAGPSVNPDEKLIQNLQLQVQIQEEINDGKARQASIDQALARLSTNATDAQKKQVATLAGQLFDEAALAAQKKAMDDVNKSVDQQINKLHESTQALGESDEQKFVDAQLLQTENDLVRKGITDIDAKTAALDRVRQAATEAYEAQQQQTRINEVTAMERSAYESLGNSIAEATAKGQLSFKTLLSIGLDVAQQLEEAFLKLLIINPIENSIFGGTPGYSNLPTMGDFGKTVLGKAVSSASSGIGDVLGDIGDFFGGFFADGGQVGPSKAIMVGEEGPEMFVPNVAGTIVPNSKLSGGGTSSAPARPAITLNVTTRDAGSFLKSESQVAAMMSRALARGQRNL